MSETSADKTKRKYLKILNEYEWKHQYTVFYEDTENSIHLLDDMVSFKHALRRKYPETAFFIRIQMHRRKFDHEPSQLQAILVILASNKLENLDVQWWVQRYFSYSITVLNRKVNDDKLLKLHSTIKSQKPHDLHKIFKGHTTPIKRFTLLNEAKAVRRKTKLTGSTDED